ncbi:MAG TPA: LacI family DNA-binding transcriptional regulator [Bryobacteraceae bacterium]|nr:LacI family DNA-binding transcriptional regulator [Bryobacteraceae bacterium]
MPGVSIKDIARIAGVSHSTVSRALRSSPLIPEKTRQRIQRIAEKHGYSADAVARSLTTRKTLTIGVVVTSIADPFNSDVVDGIEDVANKAGYSVVLATSQADPERELAVVRTLCERRMDGVLVASSRVGALYTEHFANLEIPLVLLNNQHPADVVHSVTIDNRDGGAQVAEHLASLGHTKVGYVGDRLGLHSDRERYEGFRDALRSRGIRLLKEFVVRGDGKLQGAREAAAPLLQKTGRPTAIFCYNDMSALGVMEEAERCGIEVPRQLSICGFDGLFFAPFLKIPLTTVHQPRTEIGRQAMEMLLSRLRAEDVRNAQGQNTVKIKGRLVVRGSTAPPPA